MRKLAAVNDNDSLFWVQALTEYALYSGDLNFTWEMLPVAEKIMTGFSLRSMPGNAIISGKDEEGRNCYDASLTAMFITALERMAQTYAFMSMTSGFMPKKSDEHLRKANSYMDICETMRRAFNEIFFDSENGFYAAFSTGDRLHTNGFSETANVMAIYCGACKGTLRTEIAKKLMTAPHGYVQDPVSLSTVIYKYEALLLEDALRIDYVMGDIEEKWGEMLFSGATSFGTAIAPIIVYYKYILGLRPIRPGFSEYFCMPKQYSSHKVTGSVTTPAGRFRIAASQEKYDYKLS